MKLSKRQLRRIIREEYNRLKRRDLIIEASYTPGLSLADAAEEMAVHMDLEEPGSVKQASIALRRGRTPSGYAWDMALEALDQDGSGEWPEDDAIDALARAISNRLHGKHGRYNPR